MRLYLQRHPRLHAITTGPDFLRYGGRTSCLAIAAGPVRGPALVLAAGTGLREVTGLLDCGPFRGANRPSLHLHYGITYTAYQFFRLRPGGRRGSGLLLPEQDGGLCAEAVLERGMSPPRLSPIRHAGTCAGAGRSAARRRGAASRSRPASPWEAREIPHPQGGRTFGYRVSDGRSTVAYLPDHCPTRLGLRPGRLG